MLSNVTNRHVISFSVSHQYFRIKSNKAYRSKLSDLLFVMPKEEPHLKDIRKLRMEKRTKRFSTQPSTIYWQVLGAGCYGGPTSLYLHTDHRRFSHDNSSKP